MLGECIFCGNEKVRERTIWRSELVQIFPTNAPVVPGHVLICPVRCILDAEALTNEELSALFAAQTMMKPALTRVFGAQGFNFAWNEGAPAGQTVAHLHIHMLPRVAGDTGITQYEPREFLYRPGKRAASAQAELVEIARDIKLALGQA